LSKRRGFIPIRSAMWVMRDVSGGVCVRVWI